MKKSFLIILLAIGISSSSFAQEFSFGLKAGANFSNFTGGDFSSVKKQTRIGFYGGGFMNFWFGDNLSLQPGVQVSTQGVKVEDSVGKEDYSLTYISVPVFLKYKTDGGFYVEAGPQVGFKIGENIPDQTIGKFAKNLDLSIGAGLGYQSSGGLGIGARYLVGLSKVGDFNASQGDPDFKNSVIQVGISYTIGGGPKSKKK